VTKYQHTPVLLKQVIECLAPRPGGIYFDGTLGGGSYSEAILEAISPDGIVIGVDVDEDAITAARERLRKFGARAQIEKASYADVARIASHPRENGDIGTVHEIPAFAGMTRVHEIPAFAGMTRVHEIPAFAGMTSLREDDMPFNGMVLDLGISSHQVDEASRGFSFSKDARLDMRMDKGAARTAADIINEFSEVELKELFERYGEERFAGRIARAITAERKGALITRTTQLEKICYTCYPPALRRGRIHPATKVFQALRIEVNGELKNLEAFLEKAPALLKEGGRIAVVSYHSLEDRIVKTKFRELAKGGGFKILTKKPVEPSEEETRDNPRARSAKLRAIEAVIPAAGRRLHPRG
jgi:16S rRNA (cytosine1402-N4)-methyltransferase